MDLVTEHMQVRTVQVEEMHRVADEGIGTGLEVGTGRAMVGKVEAGTVREGVAGEKTGRGMLQKTRETRIL
jgi:hypothetical protein